MAGFREFVTGEVLTAANVDDFLAKQAVMKFADAAARDSALGTAVASGNALREGMVAYLDSEDLPSFYNGTSWTTEFGGGNLVASKFVIKTDTQVSSLTTGNSAAVSGLTIDHSVADAANHVILIAQMTGSQQAGLRPAFSLTAGGTAIAIGDAAGSRVRVGASSSSYSVAGDVMGSMTLAARHTPGVTTSVTYGVNIVNVRTSTVNNFVNRDGVDGNNANSARSASTLLLLEVKV